MQTQTITLENEQYAAVFTEDGRVFYDLNVMVATMAKDISARVIAVGPETLTDDERIYLAGQHDLLKGIVAQSTALRAAHTLDHADTIADMFKE